MTRVSYRSSRISFSISIRSSRVRTRVCFMQNSMSFRNSRVGCVLGQEEYGLAYP